jgi:hypothetical protein
LVNTNIPVFSLLGADDQLDHRYAFTMADSAPHWIDYTQVGMGAASSAWDMSYVGSTLPEANSAPPAFERPQQRTRRPLYDDMQEHQESGHQGKRSRGV